ncbi:nucleotide pyrophosphohydrolase [Candidatus Arthromitus sp. SFB-rat-Yit]|uniref:nucleotide pyrophosphohydrolase n=1 Tax=Candidatus Arthromitus sp. SFB-rat-Yit TaxID=1041504 RepID=UPI000227A170|nr:nucleotide pyrophosphohydrolase [Candidatus Arthromitus sp. SFB-rat-Yit]BAK81294.1 putative pyrophosphatase [Candidatus Arthromitus sp. SFB-rat-Yit]
MELNDSRVNLEELKIIIKNFESERGWDKFRNPKDLSMSIAIEAAELMEIFQWDTTDEANNIKNSDKFEHFCEELADVMIYSISLANSLDIDLYKNIMEKLRKNSIKYPKKK